VDRDKYRSHTFLKLGNLPSPHSGTFAGASEEEEQPNY